jgi:hypothetical protein
MRWPSGPLDIARVKDLAARDRQTLERWHDPATLELLEGTPVDFIVLSWAAGLPEDAAQQRSAPPLIEAARQRGISVVGWVSGGDLRAAIATAKAAGLAAVAVEDFRGSADLPVISYGKRTGVPWNSASPILAVTGNLWPGVANLAGSGNAAAGPTSLPWLDSNGWYVHLARARTRTPLWLLFDTPGKPAIVPAQGYTLAICDAEAAGARWVISLDEDFRAGLADRNADYRKRWVQIAATAAFFLKHDEWRTYAPLGFVGVLSDFEGPRFDFAGEVLNLMARRDLLCQPIWKTQALNRPLDALKVIVCPDGIEPETALKRKIMSFVDQGGLLIAGPEWRVDGRRLDVEHPRFTLLGVGRGRIARARTPMQDPYLLAGDAQSFLSHSNDLVKFFNGASSGCAKYTASPDHKKALLQVLSYASARQAGRTSVWLRDQYRAAKLWTLGAAAPRPVDVVRAEDFEGWECHLPATSSDSYLALELDT